MSSGDGVTQRAASAAVWLGLLTTAFVFAPPAAPDTGATITKMMTGQLEGLNVPLFALFNLMGVFPMCFLAVLAFDSTEQRVWKWPFVLGSFALGAFVLLPYFIFRRWGLPRREPASRFLRVVGSRGFGAVMLVSATALGAAFFTGDLRGFAHLFQTQQFPFVMSFDFVACWLGGVLLSAEEAQLRRQPILRWLGCVPVVGLPLVLTVRRTA